MAQKVFCSPETGHSRPLNHFTINNVQTWFCIKLSYHSKPFGAPGHSTVIPPFETIFANGFEWSLNSPEKGTKSRRVNKGIKVW